jgi:hypothetical protein
MLQQIEQQQMQHQRKNKKEKVAIKRIKQLLQSRPIKKYLKQQQNLQQELEMLLNQ